MVLPMILKSLPVYISVWGILYQHKRQLGLAEEHFERAAFLEPEVPEYQLQLARNHVLRENWTGASEVVQALLELDPVHESGLALCRAYWPVRSGSPN